MKLSRKALVLGFGALIAFISISATFGSAVRHAQAWPGSDSIRVSQVCRPDRTVSLSISWNSYSRGTQYVDISHYNSGFFYGTYVANGPFAPYTSSFTPGYGIDDNRWTYIRVNTLVDGYFWSPSETYTVYTIDCSAIPPGCYGYGPAPATILPCPRPNVSIWIDRGEGSTYRIGEGMTVCYSVSAPMYIQIVDYPADGTQQTFTQGFDDGRGDCLRAYITPPRGRERLTIYGDGGMSDTATFYVR